MRANELRIGNWVDNNGTQFQIKDGEDIDDHLDHDCFKPIPLTEEWLVKFGFVYSDDDGIVSYSKKDIIIFLMFGLDFYFKLNHYKHAPIEFVHQLQNLYFALTGEELTINN